MADSFIDNAMDAAEAKLTPNDEAAIINDVQQVETAEVKEFTKETETPKAEAKESSTRVRDDSGKFTKAQKAIQDQKDLNDQVATEETVEEVEQPPIDPPKFWSAEKKDAFAKAPRDVQEAIIEHENQRNEFANRLASENQVGKTFQKRMYEDLGNDPEAIRVHKSKLSLHGIKDEVEELHRYRSWNTIFESDPYSGIADLMKKNGLTPHDFLNGYGQEELSISDPRVEQALEDARLAREESKKIQERFEQEEQFRFQREVETFKQGTDSVGQVRKQFAEAYAPQIDQAFKYIAENNPQMSFSEALHHAYEYVATETAKLHGITRGAKPQPKTPEKVIATATKAQAAVTSKPGAPANGSAVSRPNAKTLDEALDRAEERLASRRY